MERHGRAPGYGGGGGFGGGGGWESEYGWNGGNPHDPYYNYYDRHSRNAHDAQQYMENQQRRMTNNKRYRPMGSTQKQRRDRGGNRNSKGSRKSRWGRPQDQLGYEINRSMQSANMTPIERERIRYDVSEEDPKFFRYEDWEAFGKAEKSEHIKDFFTKVAATQAALERAENQSHRGNDQGKCFHERVLRVAPEVACVADDPEQIKLYPERLFPDEPEKVMLTHFPSCVDCKRISYERYPFYIGGPQEDDKTSNGRQIDDKDPTAAAAEEEEGLTTTQGLEPKDPRLGGEKPVKFPRYVYVPGPFREKEADEKGKEEKAVTTTSPGADSPKGDSGSEMKTEKDGPGSKAAPKGTPWLVEAVDVEAGEWYFGNEQFAQVGPNSMSALRNKACRGEIPWGLSLHRFFDGTDTILKPYKVGKHMSQLPGNSQPTPSSGNESKLDQWLNEALLHEKEEYIRHQEMASDDNLRPIQPHSYLRKKIHRKVFDALKGEMFKDCVKSILKKRKMGLN